MSPAHAINGDDVINKMTVDQRHSYLVGLIDGLAYSRFLRDRPNEDSSKCVYDWYYEGGKDVKLKIRNWFNRHPDKPATALMYVLVKKECGK